jgi:surface protein
MITDTTALFYQLSAFNGNISEWEVSSITSMNSMFYGATAFNGDISKWDVSSVFRMSSMFREARAFNGDISGWDVSNVKGMESMFREATAFNGDISEWDVSSATSMESMLRGATAFNGSISEWDVSSVTSMAFMFAGATAFNSDISEWDVSSSTDTRQMFYGATAFEQTLCWDLMNELYSLSMFNGSSGGLDPKCGKYIATTGNIWGRLHRLPLQFTKRESPDLDAYDDNEIETIPLIIGPHMPPFCTQCPIDTTSGVSVGWAERQGVRLVMGMTLLVVALAY